MPMKKLRNFGKFLRVYIALLVAAVAMATFSSCTQTKSWPGNNESAVIDSVTIADQVSIALNPQFTDVKEVIAYRLSLEEQYSIDSTFESLPQHILKNAASVVINRDGHTDKKSIVAEYRANKSVYDNLPIENPTANSDPKGTVVDLTSTDLGNRRDDNNVISTSYNYRTDTINGKPVKIQVKKEESYVRE